MLVELSYIIWCIWDIHKHTPTYINTIKSGKIIENVELYMNISNCLNKMSVSHENILFSLKACLFIKLYKKHTFFMCYSEMLTSEQNLEDLCPVYWDW